MENHEIDRSVDGSESPTTNFISRPEKSMYDIELHFLHQLKAPITNIKSQTHSLLVSMGTSLNNHKLPYSIFRSFEAILKQERQLQQFLNAHNADYSTIVQSRNEAKKQTNSEFRLYLNSLNQKKEQLKQVINELEKKVQVLEEKGLSPFVDFYTKLPLNMDLRLNYNSKILLSRTETRYQVGAKIKKQIKQKPPQIQIPDDFDCKLELIVAQQLYKFRQLKEKVISIHSKKEQQRKTNERLKTAHKLIKEEIQKAQKQQLIKQHSKTLTQTDYFIYLKQLHRQLCKRRENHQLCYRTVKLHSKSAPK